MKVNTVAILGGGIMGCSVSLELARRGVKSVIFEAAEDLFSGASRWNEGKIHLGYLYSADPTLRTAEKVIPGGLQFRSLVEQQIETSIADVITQGDDLFLCHARSVVPRDAMASYFQRVDELVREQCQAGDYLADLRSVSSRALDKGTLRGISPSGEIVAGFTVPERSVDTNWIADRFVAAVRANDRIELRTGTRVLGVAEETAGRWQVLTTDGREGPFDIVVNALWHGRIAIDHTVPIPLPSDWSHRYRVSLFIRTRIPVDLPSLVIAAGPFGDIKNYNGRDFYLSWYPTGLLSESRDLLPPDIARPAGAVVGEMAASIFEHLGRMVPAVRDIAENVESLDLAGGWVYAAASGSLADPQASLHHRKDFGIFRKGGYFSADTGKYSTAPWLARKLVREFLGDG